MIYLFIYGGEYSGRPSSSSGLLKSDGWISGVCGNVAIADDLRALRGMLKQLTSMSIETKTKYVLHVHMQKFAEN